jgi:uncharacterized membrane protein
VLQELLELVRNMKKYNLLWFSVTGAVLGGLIAIVGFWLLSPPTDSIVLFVLLRVGVGAVAATIIGVIRKKLSKQ